MTWRVFLAVYLSSLLVGGGIGWITYSRTTNELAHDHNALACAVRGLIVPARARSVQTALDKTQSESARARARQSVKTDDDFLAALITIPRGLDCSKFHP